VRLLFVTPAHLRYSLSAVVFAQRADTIASLAAAGIESQCVVIACDDNLDLARSAGFAVVERDNSHLGQRWNDGYEYAADHGYTHIAPIGSDSWVDHRYFLNPFPAGQILTSVHYALVNEDGGRLAELAVEPAGGVGPHTFATSLIAKAGNRPVEESLDRGCDHSLLTAITAANGKAPTYAWRNLHPLQYIGFRSHDLQLNPYQPLRDRYSVHEHTDPWGALAQHYPSWIVKLAQTHYESQPPRRETAADRAYARAERRRLDREARTARVA